MWWLPVTVRRHSLRKTSINVVLFYLLVISNLQSCQVVKRDRMRQIQRKAVVRHHLLLQGQRWHFTHNWSVHKTCSNTLTVKFIFKPYCTWVPFQRERRPWPQPQQQQQDQRNLQGGLEGHRHALWPLLTLQPKQCTKATELLIPLQEIEQQAAHTVLYPLQNIS